MVDMLDFLLVTKLIVTNDFIAGRSRNLKFSDQKCIRHMNLFLSDYKFSLLLINFRIFFAGKTLRLRSTHPTIGARAQFRHRHHGGAHSFVPREEGSEA